jgi:Calx-beta domain
MQFPSHRISNTKSTTMLLAGVMSLLAAAQTYAGAGAGTLQLSAPSYAVSQSKGSVTITVTRTGGSGGRAWVSYATANGTAAAGTNYTAKSGQLAWGARDAASKSVTIPINSTAFSGSKTFKVTLSRWVWGNPGTPAAATITINGTSTGGGGTTTGTGAAAKLAAELGKPNRLLVGLGGQGNNNGISGILSQALKPDIWDEYLVNAGSGDWTTWNSPAGAYVGIVASAADSVGAVPMFTLYQMATNGDGNLSSLTNSSFMTRYWSNVRLMYQQINNYGKPALVNLEPDFWGYAEQLAGSRPAAVSALVTINSDCAGLTNDVAGVAGCLVKMARQYAPRAYVGFPPSDWGANGDVAAVAAFMKALGAQNADFVVAETLDRDAGCFEKMPQPAECVRSGAIWYWDATNQKTPTFAEHLANVNTYHTVLGGLPVIWWQTPMGVPSATPGGSDYHYRDNREQYFLTHPTELTAVGGLGVVFSAGENHQTTIFTDGGQFQSLDNAYLAAPAPLP